MARLALVFGSVLVVLGIGAFLLAGASNKVMTALIPAAVGIIMVLLAAITRKNHAASRAAMHAAALLNLLGAAAGLFMGMPNILGYFRGDESLWLKALTQGGMGLICLAFLILCLRSFVQARALRVPVN